MFNSKKDIKGQSLHYPPYFLKHILNSSREGTDYHNELLIRLKESQLLPDFLSNPREYKPNMIDILLLAGGAIMYKYLDYTLPKAIIPPNYFLNTQPKKSQYDLIVWETRNLLQDTLHYSTVSREKKYYDNLKEKSQLRASTFLSALRKISRTDFYELKFKNDESFPDIKTTNLDKSEIKEVKELLLNHLLTPYTAKAVLDYLLVLEEFSVGNREICEVLTEFGSIYNCLLEEDIKFQGSLYRKKGKRSKDFESIRYIFDFTYIKNHFGHELNLYVKKTSSLEISEDKILNCLKSHDSKDPLYFLVRTCKNLFIVRKTEKEKKARLIKRILELWTNKGRIESPSYEKLGVFLKEFYTQNKSIIYNDKERAEQIYMDIDFTDYASSLISFAFINENLLAPDDIYNFLRECIKNLNLK